MQIQTQLKIQIQLKIQMPEHHEEKSEDTEPFFSALWRQKQLWHVVAVVVTIVVTIVVTGVVTVFVTVSVSDSLQVRSLLSLLNLFWNCQSSAASGLYFLDLVFPSDSTKTSSVLSKSQPSSFSEL